MGGFLLVNPRSGSGEPDAGQLVTAARERGLEARVLSDGDDVGHIARSADAEALGIAGGDGSLATVAAIAIERSLPFVCVPFGTRNHFARDLGLDRDDPVAALDSFGGDERRVDVGRVSGSLFLNNVSLGLYAGLVHRRERHRRRDALARVRALVVSLRHRHRVRFEIEGERVAARVVLVANNAYSLDVFDVGARERLDEGKLHLYVPEGLFPSRWHDRAAESLTVDVEGHRVQAAIDGEPVELETPLDFRIEPGALRVLLPGAPE